VVRVHRAGEGAPYTGLKPAGLDVAQHHGWHGNQTVIPVAEHAIETGSVDALLKTLTSIVEAQTRRRFERAIQLKEHAGGTVPEARAYVEAMLGLQVWVHKLYQCTLADPHEGTHEHGSQ
jgi:hypothetical protein